MHDNKKAMSVSSSPFLLPRVIARNEAIPDRKVSDKHIKDFRTKLETRRLFIKERHCEHSEAIPNRKVATSMSGIASFLAMTH
ncbi:MAG: hypothetical protein JWR76_532 [Mucilaginibacter sp.]|jgi:hypothetical protein|nr:hypothetical protein [Mucilaginibacter sp.]